MNGYLRTGKCQRPDAPRLAVLFVLLVQSSLYARFEHAGVLAEVAKLPEHVGRSLATELWILSGRVCAPARHVNPPTGVFGLCGVHKKRGCLIGRCRRYCGATMALLLRNESTHLPAQMYAHYCVNTNVQFPTDSRLDAEHHSLSDEAPDTAARGKRALSGREGFIVEKRLVCLKQSGADNDKRCNQTRVAFHGGTRSNVTLPVSIK